MKKPYEQPYEQGYYDGYRDCKHFYEKLLREANDDKKRYENMVYSLNSTIDYMQNERRENQKLIQLGQAVRTIMEERH